MPMKNWFASTEAADEMPADLDALESNPEPRAQGVLVLDTSGSMSGEKIKSLNEGIRELAAQLKADELARERIEIAIVTFGPVTVAQDFILAKDFIPKTFKASGTSPLGEAVCRSVEMVEGRWKNFKRVGIDSFKPFVFGITDGHVRDGSFDEARTLIRKFETAEAEADRIAFFFAGVGGADMEALAELSHRKPLPLDPSKFGQMFRWIGQSMRNVSRSLVGEEVDMPNVDWMKL